jgi:hypothetical protein
VESLETENAVSLAMTVASDKVILVPASRTVPQTLKVVGVGAVTTTWALPITLWYVARISASPAAMVATNPVDETVATAAADDCHVA